MMNIFDVSRSAIVHSLDLETRHESDNSEHSICGQARFTHATQQYLHAMTVTPHPGCQLRITVSTSARCCNSVLYSF